MFFQRNRQATDWLIVCLGNPGDRYDGTRHNAGFLVADLLSKRSGTPIRRAKHKALTTSAVIGGEHVLLMKPTTFMNLSGEAAGEAARFYKVPPERVLVVSDDTDLPLGKIRVRTAGSAGGHNGLKSIICHLGTDRFPRVKIGVGGKPHPSYGMADWVLSKVTGPDKVLLDEAVLRAADAVECYLRDGPDQAMARFN